MIKKCLGCGIVLQDKDVNSLGYTPKIENDLCQRCFKLKHYGEKIDIEKKQNNNTIINKINKEKAIVLYLIDFLNINKETVAFFKEINSFKYFIITKSDIIPRNIKLEKLITNIKREYLIEEEIILCSIYDAKNNNKLKNIIESNKVIFCGITNMGKSSLINKLTNSDITISNKENTTQEFIKIKNIIDTPGFICDYKIMVPKSKILPKTYQLKSKYYLKIDDLVIGAESDTLMTLYFANETKINKRKKIDNYKYLIKINKNQDLVIKGMGFIKFSTDALIYLNSDNYEIRNSIVGDSYEN